MPKSGDSNRKHSGGYTEHNAEENRQQIRNVQTFQLVAEHICHALHIFLLAYYNDTVAKLQMQVRSGDKVNTGTLDSGDRDMIAVIDA